MSVSKTYSGKIIEQDCGDAMDIIFLDGFDEPLAEVIQDDMEEFGRTVSVNYYVSDEAKTREQLDENEVRKLAGDLEADYAIARSDITGYLWTDEELMVGGHDLLEEIRSNVGKYLYLEILYEVSSGASN